MINPCKCSVQKQILIKYLKWVVRLLVGVLVVKKKEAKTVGKIVVATNKSLVMEPDSTNTRGNSTPYPRHYLPNYILFLNNLPKSLMGWCYQLIGSLVSRKYVSYLGDMIFLLFNLKMMGWLEMPSVLARFSKGFMVIPPHAMKIFKPRNNV